MNDLFQRRSVDDKQSEIRRMAVVLFAVLVASASWHALRPIALAWIAQTSLGCPSRAPIVAAVLRGKYDTIPTDSEINAFTTFPWTRLGTSFFPKPGWVWWESVRETEQLSPNSWLHHWRTTFADHNFDAVGSIGTTLRPLVAPAQDTDGDGCWEVVLETQATPWQEAKNRNVKRWAIVRLGENHNEVAWIGLGDQSLWSRKSTRIKPIWRDEDGDGVDELVFVTVVVKRLPQGGVGFDPPTVVAVFEWDRAGGILLPRLLPQDTGIMTWTAPDAESVRVEQDADIESVLNDLLPVPDGFGVAPGAAPSTPSPPKP